MSARHNIWPFGAGQPLGSRTTHHRRTSSAKAAQREAREREATRLESKLSASDLNKRLQRHYAKGGTLSEFLQANPGIPLTRELAYAAARDAGARSMRKAGRTAWSRADYNAAAREFQRLCGRRGMKCPAVNPGTGAFERCVEAVTEKGGAYDPRAVCAAAGRKKYGAKKFQAMAQAGRKRAARNVGEGYGVSYKDSPEIKVRAKQSSRKRGGYGSSESPWMYFGGLQDFNEHLRGLQDQANRQKVSFSWRIQRKERGEWQHYEGDKGTVKPAARGNPVLDPTVGAYLGSELSKLGAKLRKKAVRNPVGWQVWSSEWTDGRGRRIPKTLLFGGKLFASKKEAEEYWYDGVPGPNDHAAFVRIGKRNPADAAAEMYEKFHGRPSGEVVEISKDVFYHGNLAALGELEKLTVRANDGVLVDLEGFKGAILCSNERGTQLYIEGGDQAVKLSAFGIGKPYHDVEDLGEVVKLWYFTTKDHLGDQGGEASYHHRLSEEGKVRMQQDFGQRRAPRPRLVYDTQNKALGFAGGEYTVEPEGIRN